MNVESPGEPASADAPRPTLPVRHRVAAADAGTRVDRYIKRIYPKLPIGVVFKLLRKRKITVDRKRTSASSRLEADQVVEVFENLDGYTLPPGEHLRRAARVRDGGHFQKQFRVLHEDTAIIVLDKPAGIVVHPGPRHHTGDTLLDLLKAHLPELYADDSDYAPGFAHRLDRGTSGVIVAAKTRAAAQALEVAFRSHLARKTYITLVAGIPKKGGGKIDYPIEHERTPSGKNRFTAVKARGRKRQLAGRMQAALTRYRVRERFPGASLVEVETETGRTHQIRAHMTAIGHPLAGDGDYGKRLTNRRFREDYGLEHLLLHAWRLELPHPATGETMRFDAPTPPELERVLAKLRRRAEKDRERREQLRDAESRAGD